MKIEYNTISPFQKDIKRLLKKFQTLEDDLETVKRDVIELYHLKRIDNQSIFPIPGFCTEEVMVYKIKKFACRSLKGKGSRSGIRIIYAYHCQDRRVTFIEIYFKSNKENEDQGRIKNYLKKPS